MSNKNQLSRIIDALDTHNNILNNICNILMEEKKKPILKCIMVQVDYLGRDMMRVHKCITHAMSVTSFPHSRNGYQEIVHTFNHSGCCVDVEDVYTAKKITEDKDKEEFWWIK
jgi:hypothetical protein